ncbi:MAG TPA: secondary thiamine-phosphate synthase enzyme YjbQ [Flavobacterium sp.]|nr:secondary thiamine-phosphate synthase enzyme YjbQ [Flavobacterium sp.]
MPVIHHTIHITTTKQFQVFPITDQIEQVVAKSGIKNGICNVFVPHSTASIRLNDNEPMLHQDVMREFYRLVPIDTPYGHDNFEAHSTAPQERTNGHAHLKAFVAGSSETIPVVNARLDLGKHQHIFLMEFDGGRSREVRVTLLGE